MLDQLAEKNGLSPAMYRLNEEQQLTVGNQLSSLLKKRLNSWGNIERLIAGDIMLDDLHDNESLEPLSKSVDFLLQKAKKYVLAGDYSND